MNKNLITWQLIDKSIEQQIPVMLLYVLESKGSSPGRQGFFMAVNFAGETAGSIGGGIMEHKFVEMSKERLQENDQTSLLRKQIHDKTAAKNQSGMICSGEQTVLLYQVSTNDRLHILHLISSISQFKNGLLRLSPAGLQFFPDQPMDDFLFVMQNENDWLYEEKTGYKNQLYIVGAGHCSLALSKIMSLMDFYIRVYDDRTDLPTLTENEFAHEKILVDDYAELNNLIPSGKNHYVVVMTVGYRTDNIALQALLGKSFRYFGVLGSKKKMEKLFSEYENDGGLKNIKSPVGFPIKSQTPEEIAISIAAEIIQEKNKDL